MIGNQGALSPQSAGIPQELMQLIDAVVSGQISLEEASQLTGIPVQELQALLAEGSSQPMGALQLNEGGQVWKPGENTQSSGPQKPEEILQDFKLQSLGSAQGANQAAAQSQQASKSAGSTAGQALGTMVAGPIGGMIGGALGGMLFNEGGMVPGDAAYLNQGGWSPFKNQGKQGSLAAYKLQSLGTAAAAAHAAAADQKAKEQNMELLKTIATTKYEGEDGTDTTLASEGMDKIMGIFKNKGGPVGSAYLNEGGTAGALSELGPYLLAMKKGEDDESPLAAQALNMGVLGLIAKNLNKGGPVESGGVGPYVLSKIADEGKPAYANVMEHGLLGLLSKNLSDGGYVGPVASVEHKRSKGDKSEHVKQSFHNPLMAKGGM